MTANDTIESDQAPRLIRAIWNDEIIAEGTDVVMLEGKYYFRPEDVRVGVLRPTSHSTLCPWKGRATYFDVTVGDRTSRNGGWVYPAASAAASAIEGRVAFWRGVLIRRDDARREATWVTRLFRRRLRRTQMTLDSRLDITPLTSPGDAHLDASTENVSAALPSLAGLLDGQPTILDFWAPWCGPCKVLHPMFEAVAATHADTPVRFTRVNVDTHPQLAESFGVMSIPTLVLCDADGDEIERIVGLPEGRRLQELAARAVTLVG